MRVLFWGTYDTGKPRVRILLRGLREAGVDVLECHSDIWGGVEDKSQLKGIGNKLRFAGRWLLSYPSLIWRFLRAPNPDIVIVGYLGHLDILFLWVFAKFRRVPVVWDAFISLYNTVVEDRKLVGTYNPLAGLIYIWEWLACRAADLVLIDTQAHGEYFIERFHLRRERISAVFVGAETEQFDARNPECDADDTYTVLFYGQFIPLHGIPTIIKAARLLQGEDIRWIIIGEGQEQALIREMLNNRPLPKVEWVPWVAYEKLGDWISKANVCLGIFDAGDKASRVIPNKVFQILAAGKPLITRDSPAIRELLTEEEPAVWLIEPNDPEALANAIKEAKKVSIGTTLPFHEGLRESFSTREIGIRLRTVLSRLQRTRSQL